MMTQPRQRGQGLTEFALVLPVLIGLVIAFIDLTPLAVNMFLAYGATGRAARAAAVWYPDGFSSCRLDATNALGSLGFIHATYDMEIDAGCDNNPLATNPTGESMYATITVHYQPLFFGTFGWPPPSSPEIWDVEVTSVDQVR
jgi:hypothetical protein